MEASNTTAIDDDNSNLLKPWQSLKHISTELRNSSCSIELPCGLIVGEQVCHRSRIKVLGHLLAVWLEWFPDSSFSRIIQPVLQVFHICLIARPRHIKVFIVCSLLTMSSDESIWKGLCNWIIQHRQETIDRPGLLPRACLRLAYPEIRDHAKRLAQSIHPNTQDGTQALTADLLIVESEPRPLVFTVPKNHVQLSSVKDGKKKASGSENNHTVFNTCLKSKSQRQIWSERQSCLAQISPSPKARAGIWQYQLSLLGRSKSSKHLILRFWYYVETVFLHQKHIITNFYIWILS